MKETRIRKILFSQNFPANFEKSPYANFLNKYHAKVDFYKFFQVEGLPVKDFLSKNISISKHDSVILTSKNAVEHFFCIANELKINIPIATRYFCTNEGIADHLQRYDNPDKRKIFFSENGSSEKLIEKITKYSSDTFLLPTAMDSANNQLVELLDENKINYTKAEIFKILFANVREEIDIYSYSMLVFFSPCGIQSLMHNYPDFKQNNIIIGTFGTNTFAAAQEAGLNVQIIAPSPEHSSIFSAVDKYLQKSNPPQRNKNIFTRRLKSPI
jgi:uroporphyrinogen-III synthase